MILLLKDLLKDLLKVQIPMPFAAQLASRHYGRHYGKLKAILLAGVLLSSTADAALAAVVQPHPPQPDPAISILARQARGRVPGRRRGGARRGACLVAETATELTALVPDTETTTLSLPETYVGGSTTAAYPTFWFYVPYHLTADLKAEFILQDEAGQDLYRAASAELPISEPTPGIVSVTLPATAAPLEVGKVYQWYFKLSCAAEEPIYVQGGIERVAPPPELASQLANATPQEQAQLYWQNELWYDAATILARLHQSNPTDPTIQSAWGDLLRSVGLEDILIE
jgi:hypothetical protein